MDADIAYTVLGLVRGLRDAGVIDQQGIASIVNAMDAVSDLARQQSNRSAESKCHDLAIRLARDLGVTPPPRRHLGY